MLYLNPVEAKDEDFNTRFGLIDRFNQRSDTVARLNQYFHLEVGKRRNPLFYDVAEGVEPLQPQGRALERLPQALR